MTGTITFALASACALTMPLAGCSGDDDDDASNAARGGGGAAAGRGGAAGNAGRGGRGGTAGTAGSDAGSGGGGGRGGSGTSGTAGEAGGPSEAGGGGAPNDGGAGGSAGVDEGGSGGTSGSSGSAGKASIIDPDTYDGQQVFRHDTFGDERFWTDTLRLHEAVQAALDPTTALGLGLKVDAAVLPEGILETADLNAPATTVALIGLGAVVGIEGSVSETGELTSLGITCALCHSDVDDSVMPGIGLRVDGAANRDLDPGAIIALSPGLAGNDAALTALNGWGPGFYDARWNQDGISEPVLIPPIYGLSDVPVETYTGDGPVSYWNAYVAVTQMGGIGQFFDPRIDVAVSYDQDLVSPKLPALFDYQMSLQAPAAPSGSFDADAAARGQALFSGAATCSGCHSGDSFSDAGQALHAPAETGMDPTAAERSATGLYRTTPLRALAAHPPYFHDGSAATLADVVAHYDEELGLGLSDEQRADLVEYLKSL